jgi:DNA-binding transcriptional ArsR family regulator
MASTARFAEIACLAGDPARASILLALAGGRALAATELAKAAGVTAQTTSGHLGRMTAAGLLRVEKSGRCRYYAISSLSVARMLECILQVAAELEPNRSRISVGPKDAAMRRARMCHDHLAGKLGVALADALVAGGHVEISDDGGVLTDSGVAFLRELGAGAAPLLESAERRSAGVFCRPCMDWSEQRPHLAGTLGALLCACSFERGWILRQNGTRAVTITPAGARAFHEEFGATWEPQMG